MLPAFKLGLGGRLGAGTQYMSWVTTEDLSSAVIHILKNENLSGAVNGCSPEPLTNAQFTQTLARVLKRPAFFHIPAWLLSACLGEVAENLFFSSTRVKPEKLLNSGFTFRHSKVEDALKSIIKSKG